MTLCPNCFGAIGDIATARANHVCMASYFTKPRIKGPMKSDVFLPSMKRFYYTLVDGRTRSIDCPSYAILAWAIANKQEGIAWA